MCGVFWLITPAIHTPVIHVKIIKLFHKSNTGVWPKQRWDKVEIKTLCKAQIASTRPDGASCRPDHKRNMLGKIVITEELLNGHLLFCMKLIYSIFYHS